MVDYMSNHMMKFYKYMILLYAIVHNFQNSAY
jgi:hypothetical protein